MLIMQLTYIARYILAILKQNWGKFCDRKAYMKRERAETRRERDVDREKRRWH